MILENISKKKVITRNLKIAKSLLDQFLGLLRKTNSRFLLFKTRFGVHTFFLKDWIDVIVLDDNYRVAQTKTNLKPNKVFFWNPRFNTVIELPKNTINDSKIELGDLLRCSP